MRIVVIEPDDQGGLFHFAFQLCCALGDSGHETTLITGSDPEFDGQPMGFTLLAAMNLWSRRETLTASQQRSRIRGALASVRRAYRGVKLTIAWLGALTLARARKPDVIILSMILHPHIQFMIRHLVSKRVVLAQICHEFSDREDARGDVVKPAPLVQRFDRVFFLSEAVRHSFTTATGYATEKTTRIPHGSQDALITGGPEAAQIRAKFGIEPDVPVVLFFGVLRRSKGLEDLIDAFAASEAQKTSRLVIAGRATKYIDIGKIEDRIADRGMSDKVILHNAYIDNDEIAGFFGMSQVVVLPYRSASASGVLHLAYTCARPVIATAIGGLAEDVVDGETGILVPPQDPPLLAAAMDRLLSNGELASTMGQAAKRHSEANFSWSRVASIITATLEGDIELARQTRR